jgi:hypothetical protein
MIDKGRHSRSLWGPYDGLVAHLPPNLLNIHECGVVILFICFLGPLAIIFFSFLKIYKKILKINYL